MFLMKTDYLTSFTENGMNQCWVIQLNAFFLVTMCSSTQPIGVPLSLFTGVVLTSFLLCRRHCTRTLSTKKSHCTCPDRGFWWRDWWARSQQSTCLGYTEKRQESLVYCNMESWLDSSVVKQSSSCLASMYTWVRPQSPRLHKQKPGRAACAWNLSARRLLEDKFQASERPCLIKR